MVKPYYGVDQADRSRLDEIIVSEFGEEPLDFVSDDASHLLAASRVSFNCLFPRLRPGGTYLIEDWGWGHHALREELTVNERERWLPLFTSGAPLTVLVFELVMTCASASGIIDELTIDRYFVRARRGPVQLDPATFDISRCYVEGPVKLLTSEATSEG